MKTEKPAKQMLLGDREDGEKMMFDVIDTACRLQMQDAVRQNRIEFCEKYIPILKMIEDDPD